MILQKGKVNFHFLVDLFGITSSYFISVRRKPYSRMDNKAPQSVPFPTCLSTPFNLPWPDFFSSFSFFSDLSSHILLPQLNLLLVYFILAFSFLCAFISVPFLEEMKLRNSSASSLLQIFTSKDAWNFTSSSISA